MELRAPYLDKSQAFCDTGGDDCNHFTHEMYIYRDANGKS